MYTYTYINMYIATAIALAMAAPLSLPQRNCNSQFRSWRQREPSGPGQALGPGKGWERKGNRQ